MSVQIVYDVEPEVERWGQKFTIQGSVNAEGRYTCSLAIRTGAAIVTVFPTPDALDHMADLLREQAQMARETKGAV